MTHESNYNMGKQWYMMPQTAAADIGFGANGSMFAVGSTWAHDGNMVYFKKDLQAGWQATQYIGADISVAPDGTPWMTREGDITHEGGPIFKGLERIAGEAFDISVGANGDIFVTGTKEPQVGHRIWQYINGNFQNPLKIPNQDAARIAVAPDGTPWVVTFSNAIFRLKNGEWRQLPRGARDIAIGADGSVWMVGTTPVVNGQTLICQWDENKFDWIPYGPPDAIAQFWRIAVSPDGTPFAVHYPAALVNEQSIPVTDKYPNGAVFYLK